MIAVKQFFTVIFVSVLPLAATSVMGSKHSCPAAAVVDLTEETEDSLGYVRKSDYVYPPETTWKENGKTFGCPCKFKTCIRLCCYAGNASIVDDCIKDADTLRELVIKKYDDGDVHLFANEPCSEKHSLLNYYYESWEDRLLSFEGKNGSKSYCQNTPKDLLSYLVGFCADKESSSHFLAWYVCCINIAAIFELATLIVYTVIPELKNLHGSIFRSYLVSFICCIIFISAVFLSKSPPKQHVELTMSIMAAFGALYFAIASMFWLNVISFNIWRSFRNFGPTGAANDSNVKKRQRKKFVQYSIYAWASPAVYILLAILLIGAANGKILTVNDINPFDFVRYFLLSSIVGISICNTGLYISTALVIKKRKKETAHLVGGVNKHHQENEQWFNLYMKLFILMGGCLMFWVTGVVFNNTIFWRIVFIIESLKGILIFVIFVWKDDVKRLLRKKFVEILRTLDSFRRRDPTPDIEI